MVSRLILPHSVQERMRRERDAREIDAGNVFQWALPPSETPALMRDALLNIWLDSRRPPAEMLLWIGTDVASMVYGRYAIPAKKPVGSREAADLFGFGLAAMAGNIPELFTELGYEPVRAALRAFVLAKPWKRLGRQSGDEVARARFGRKLRQYHIASHHEVGVAYRAYEAWIQHNWPKDYLGRPDDLRAKIFRDLDSKFAAPRRSSPERNREVLIKTAKAKEYAHEWSRPDDADDILAGWVIHRHTHGSKTVGMFIGSDGIWHPDARGMVDAAVVQDHYAPRRETPSSDYEASGVSLPEPANCIAPDPSEAAARAEHRNSLEQFAKLVEADDLDELDRKNVTLMRAGESRRERARQLGVDESALRKRERKMQARLKTLADPALLRFMVGDDAA